MLTPTAFIDAYDGIGQKKAGFSSAKILLLGILAGFLIGMGGVVTNTAGFALTNTSAAKVVSGLLFPFGLAMVILTGAELFTGNCLLIMPKMAWMRPAGRKKTSPFLTLCLSSTSVRRFSSTRRT